MLAKLIVVVVLAAGTSAALLSVRQQRLEAVHEMAAAVERAAEIDRKLWTVRLEIARLSSPARVERLVAMSELGPWVPIPVLSRDAVVLGDGGEVVRMLDDSVVAGGRWWEGERFEGAVSEERGGGR